MVRTSPGSIGPNGLLRFLSWEVIGGAFTVCLLIVGTYYAFANDLKETNQKIDLLSTTITADTDKKIAAAIEQRRHESDESVAELKESLDTSNDQIEKEISVIKQQNAAIQSDINNINKNLDRMFRKLDERSP
jgi:DNA anti-recombination protein RmuC